MSNQTRKALRRLGGAQYNLGEGPLAGIADEMIGRIQAAEADRMDDALRRAEQMGSGPHLAALQRVAREYAAESLRDNSAPAIMCADMHELLKTASADAGPKDRGLARAATHAYRLWSKDPAGTLTVGDVARLRDHYKNEYPRSKVAEVIDTKVPKVGFNTLPVAKLTRIAAEVMQRGGDTQAEYEHAIKRHGYDHNTPETVRARSFIRSLIDGAAQPQAASEQPDVVERALARMATAGDPILGRTAQLEMDMPEDEAELSMGDEYDDEPGMGDTEFAEVDSPITGDPMMLELETAERAEEEGELLGDNSVDIAPEDAGRLEFMGQLEDMADPAIGMDPTPDETVTVIPDPTDPEGGDLEVTLKPIEEEAPAADLDFEEPELELEQEAAVAKCAKCGESGSCECGEMDREAADEDDDNTPPWLDKKSFVVYAYSNGKRAAEPVDRFRAKGMAAALRHVANCGVRGTVHSTPEHMASEALIVLDADRGEYLQVTAEASGATESVFKPKINEQQPARMPGVPADGGAALKSDSMGKQRTAAQRLSRDEVMTRCASAGLTPETIEHRMLEGETIKVAGWTLSVNDDTDVELSFNEGHARTASLVHMDDMISTFMTHVAQSHTTPHYDVTERFIVKCGACSSVTEYLMPEDATDIDCPDCGRVAAATDIAQSFEQGNPVSGYVLVTDVPAGTDPRDQNINAKRILAAIRKVLPSATGLLRKDARLQVDLDGADEPALNRVRKVLEGRYGIQAFTIEAQAVNDPAMDAQGDPQQNATTAPGATGTYVGPLDKPAMTPGQTSNRGAPEVVDSDVAQPADTGTGAQQDFMQQSAAYVVHYNDANGAARSTPVDAADEPTARTVFARFNNDAEITKVEAQLTPPPMGGDDVLPGEPEMGGETAPLPVEQQLDMGGEPEPTGSLGMEEAEAMRAALTHYRNQGLGPMSALDQLNSQYRELLERYGEKTDQPRHVVEAETMKIAAEVWMKPAVMHSEAAAAKRAGDMPMPSSVNTQQPGKVSVPKDLGPNSDDQDSTTNALEAPKINTQVTPQGTFSDTSTEPDSDNNDPGDFGAGKPKAQHPATDQQGTSLSDTNLGKDSDTGETKTTKSWDAVSSGAANNVRSK